MEAKYSSSSGVKTCLVLSIARCRSLISRRVFESGQTSMEGEGDSLGGEVAENASPSRGNSSEGREVVIV